ncbi:hypothetical protein [Nitrosopumilus sp.]|nr:hypothetical protein [Nitrosopumilus sp.]
MKSLIMYKPKHTRYVSLRNTIIFAAYTSALGIMVGMVYAGLYLHKISCR